MIDTFQGLEDGIGDMDFKIAGTKTGITALQVHLKRIYCIVRADKLTRVQ